MQKTSADYFIQHIAAETRLFWDNKVNTIPVDGLAPYVAMIPSATSLAT